MVAIITGDIINSRQAQTHEQWLEVLKETLMRWGEAPQDWEIFRGDSFQLEIKEPAQALQAAIYLKAAIKIIKPLDVRMALGLGQKEYSGRSIAESNGSAFIRSGEKFEKLKKEKQTLAVQTGSEALDETLNLCLKLGLIAMDNWSSASAEFVKLYLDHEGASQQELGELLGISQSSVSERYSRAYLAEVLALNVFYQSKINQLLTNTL